MRQVVRAVRGTTARQRSAEVRVLVLMLGACALGGLASAAAPMTPQAPTGLNAVLGAVSLVLVALVWTVPWRRWPHVAPLAVVAGLCGVVVSAATPQGEASVGVGLVWVALYSALFCSRRLARTYVAVVAAALAVAFRLNPFDGHAHTWVFVVLTTAAASEALSSTVARLDRQALSDPLTGLLNREGLRRTGGRALAAASRTDAPATVALVDLDGFKQVNDVHGHAAGDELLVRLADVWSEQLRPGDVLARYGGDEFVLVLPDTDEASAAEVLRRLQAVSPSGWSYGLAPARPGAALADLLQEADGSLYTAKARRAAPALTVPEAARQG